MITPNDEYILCSAIKRKNEINCPVSNSDIGKVCLGYRHCDILMLYNGIVDNTSVNAQGFFTSKGRFVDRKEAYEIAVNAEQIINDERGILFLEDLY